MLAERRCGLKSWDAAVESVGRAQLIDDAIALSERYPTTWGDGWGSFQWALMNVVSEIKASGNGQMSWNIIDVLDADEMAYVASKLGLALADYIPLYQHT